METRPGAVRRARGFGPEGVRTAGTDKAVGWISAAAKLGLCAGDDVLGAETGGNEGDAHGVRDAVALVPRNVDGYNGRTRKSRGDDVETPAADDGKEPEVAGGKNSGAAPKADEESSEGSPRESSGADAASRGRPMKLDVAGALAEALLATWDE